MTTTPSNPPVFPDRRNALLVAGILEIVLGVGAWLMLVLAVFATTIVARQGAATTSMVPSLVVYGLGGVVFMTLGVGSLRLKRWARSLWLVVSASWLVMSLIGTIGMAVWMPAVLKSMPNAGPPEQMVIMKTVMGFVLAVISIGAVGVPLALFLFYRSRGIRETVEAAHPQPAWTDSCALPLLALVVWMAGAAVMLAPMPLAYGGLFPVFGHWLGGAPGYGLWWLMTAVAAISAVGLYGHRRWAWTLALAMVLVGGVSGVVTYATADLHPLFAAMGMDPAQQAIMERTGMMKPGFLVGMTVAAMLPILILLGWALAYLRPRPAAETGGIPPVSRAD